MKIFDDKGYKNTKELLDATLELIEAYEIMLEDQQEQADKLQEALDEYDDENGRGDFEAQEYMEKEIQARA